MAERLQGLSIGLDLDSIGIERSLSEIKRSFRGLDSSIKLTSNNMRFGTKSVDNYEKGIKTLNADIQKQRKNLDDLGKKHAEAVREQGKNSKAAQDLATEYNKQADNLNRLEHQLENATQELKEMQEQQRIAESGWGKMGNAFGDIGSKLKDVGRGMQDVGKNLSMYVTAPLVGMGAMAAKTGIDFDDSMRKVQAVSGATGDELNDLREKAKEMGATTRFSASESAEALNYMALAGWDTKEMLGGIDGVMNLAAASGEDLALVSDIVTDSISAFGLEAKDSAEFADVLAATSANANTDVAGLGKAFEYVAPVAGSLGFTVEDTAKAIGLMSDNGIKGEKAGTALRTMMTNLAKPTSAMEKEMSRLGISLTDSQGNMKSFDEIMLDLRESFSGLSEEQQASAAATIFGKEAMSGALAIINTTDESYEKLGEAISNSSGSAEKMAEIMEGGLGGTLREIKSGIEGFSISLFETMEPALTAVSEKINDVVKWLNDLSPKMKLAMVIVGGLAAAIGPLLVVFGTLINFLGSTLTTLAPLMKEVAKAGGLFNFFGGIIKTIASRFSFLLGPVGIAISAITTLASVFTFAYKRSETFRNGVDTIVSSVKSAFEFVKDLISGIKGLFIDDGESGRNILTSIGLSDKTVQKLDDVALKISTFRSNVKNFIEGIKGLFKDDGQSGRDILSNLGFSDKAVATLDNIALKLSDFRINVIDGIKSAFGVAVDFVQDKISVLKSFWDTEGASFLQAWKNIWDGVETAVKWVMDGVEKAVKWSIDGIVAIFEWAFPVIKSIVTPVIHGIVTVIQWAFPYISKIIDVALKVVFSIVKQVWGNIKGIITGALDVIMGAVKIFSGLFTGDFSKMWEGVKQLFSGAIKVIWNWIELSFVGRILKGVGGLATGFWGHIKNLWKWVTNTFKNSISTVYNGVRESFVGRIVRSIIDFAKNFRTNISNMWNTVKTNFTNKISEIRTAISNSFVGRMISSVTRLKDRFIGLAKDMWGGVKKQFNNIVDGAKGLPKRIGDGIRSAKDKAVSGMKSVGNSVIEWAGKPFNKVVDGVNWITGKLGIKTKIDTWAYPQYAKGTDGHPGGPAILGDGKGSNAGREFVGLPDGRSFLSADKPTLYPYLPKGTQVLPAKLTKQIPMYAEGKGWLSKAWGSVKSFTSKIGEAVGDVWSYISDPGKLVNKVMDGIGVIKDKAQIPTKLVTGGFDYLKTKPIEYVKNMFKKAEEENVAGPSGAGAKAWRSHILRAASRMNVSVSDAEVNGIIAQIHRESGGNQRITQSSAVWDVNMAAGNPARGLLQYIPQTFNAYKMKGHGNIYSGYDQLLAFFNNSNWRRDLPYGKSGWGPTGGRRYEKGGLIDREHVALVGENNKEEMIIPLEQHRSRALGLWQEAGRRLGVSVIPTAPHRRTDAMKLLALAAKRIGADGGSYTRPSGLANNTNNDNQYLEVVVEKLTQQVQLLTELVISNQRIADKPVLTEGDIGRASSKYDSRQYTNQQIFTGRTGGL